LLARIDQAEIIIVKRLIQGRNNVCARVGVEPIVNHAFVITRSPHKRRFNLLDHAANKSYKTFSLGIQLNPLGLLCTRVLFGWVQAKTNKKLLLQV